MMNVIHASGALQKFIAARSNGASPEEPLQSADEASRIRRDGNVIFLPDRPLAEQ